MSFFRIKLNNFSNDAKYKTFKTRRLLEMMKKLK